MLKKLRENQDLNKAILIYEKKEHKIDNNLIDKDALSIIKNIQKKDHCAYLVGGAVRDLLLNKKPKDFDIVTDLTPSQLRSKFKNVRVIGNRFKLVHFLFGSKKYIEVATFRSALSKVGENIYGDIEEDALRRDFSVNALYYDPESAKLYDYVGGYKDLIENHKLVPLIDRDIIFKEDPVRMLRAVKYSIKDNLDIDDDLYLNILENASLISKVSTSRLYEELVKIFISTQSYEILKGLEEAKILNYILSKVSYDLKSENPVIIANLKFFDTIVTNLDLDRQKIIESTMRCLCMCATCMVWPPDKAVHSGALNRSVLESLTHNRKISLFLHHI